MSTATMCLKMSSEKKPISPVSGGMRQILDQNSKLRAQLRDAETERAQQVSELEKSLEDLKKARWYLDKLIEEVENESR